METLQRTANRGSISTGYDIDNSLKLEADNTEYLYKTNDAGTNRKTFTVSMWFKRTELSNDYMTLWQGGENGEATRLGFYGGTPKEAIWVDIGGGTGNTGTLYRSYSNQVLRDTSAFYHIVLAVDTTQATEANRFRLWLNGEEVTSWSQRQYPVQDFECAVEASANMKWGAYDATYYKMCGYIAECHYLDGVTAVQTDFGEYDEDSGIWKPKAYAGSYGGNGCYLNFDDSASLGADSSGNGNDFTLNNITSADQSTDTPTNNFCTLNPLSAGGNRGNVISEGATKVVIENNGQQVAVGTIAVTTGKWYWEAKHTSGTYQFAGIISADSRVSGNGGVAGSSVAGSDAIALYRVDGKVFYNSDTGTSFDTDTYTNGDIIGVALDMDNGTCALYKNNSIMGNVSGTDIVARSGHASLTGAWTAMYSDGTNGVFNITYEVNFGGYTTFSISSAASDENGYGTFEYAPPSGYYALCTKNLAEYG
jgi:hypothetical protein